MTLANKIYMPIIALLDNVYHVKSICLDTHAFLSIYAQYSILADCNQLKFDENLSLISRITNGLLVYNILYFLGWFSIYRIKSPS